MTFILELYDASCFSSFLLGFICDGQSVGINNKFVVILKEVNTKIDIFNLWLKGELELLS